MLLDGGRARRGLASTSVASRAAPREMASSAARRATHTSRVGALRGAEAIGDAGLRAVCTLVAGRGAADARASAVRLGRAKRADDGRAGSAGVACLTTAGVAGVVARCPQNPAEGGRGVSGAAAAAVAAAAVAAAATAAAAAAVVAVAAAAVAAAAVAWAAMCDCHVDAVLGGVVQARGAAAVVASAAVPRGAKRSAMSNSAWVQKAVESLTSAGPQGRTAAAPIGL